MKFNYLLEKIRNTRKIVIDIETTGLDKASDEILQLSIINGNRKVLFNEYFKPENCDTWEEAMAINHITPEMVKDKKPFRKSVKKIMRIINKAELVIGYNQIYFDLPFIKANIESVLQKPYKGLEGKKLYDVMLEFAEFYGEEDYYHGGFRWQKLTTAANYFDYEFVGHDSLEDVKATLHVYENLEVEYKKHV